MTWNNIISRSVWVLIQPGNFLFLIHLLGLFLNKYGQKDRSNKNFDFLASTNHTFIHLKFHSNFKV